MVRVGRPNSAREWYCDGTTGRVRPVYRCAWPLIVGRESYQNYEKVELYQEHMRDKVRRRFTLSVTARFDGTTGKAPMYWWSWPLIVVRCVVSQTAITVVCEIIIN